MAEEKEIFSEEENRAPEQAQESEMNSEAADSEAPESPNAGEQEQAEETETGAEADAGNKTEPDEDVSRAEGTEEDADAAPANAQDAGSEEKTGAKEPGKLFKGREKKEKKDKNKELIGELEDRVKRQMAEFENFRKRTEKEKAQMFEVGAKSVIEKILPVVDNFERGLTSVPEDENSKAFVEGMKMIYKQLMTELESIGVTPIEAVGQEFNPEFHNAVMQVPSEEYETGVVAQELQKGYMYRDSVVRHSMVAVVE